MQPNPTGNAKRKTENAPRIPAIRALYNPNFRLFWFGLVVSHVGSWVQTIGQGWLVYQLTGSAKWLGFVGFASSLPMLLFLLIGGAIADRIDRRKLLFYTQSIFTLNALVLGTLVVTGRVQIWHVIAMSFVSGTVMALDAPTRQALVQDLVGDEDLMNAVALNSAVFNGARILGPALAGVLVAQVGIASCFFINSASFLAVIFALFFLKIAPRPGRPHAGVWTDLAEGLAHLRANGTTRTLVLMAAVPSIFAMPYTVLMPAFAGKVLHVQAQGYGLLMSAVGVGALTGALGLAALSNYPRRGALLLSAAALLSLALAAFTFCRSYWIALAVLPFIGMAFTTYAATTNTTLQIITPPELRGRVLSAYMVAFMGMGPIGNLQAGLVADHAGVAVALRLGAAICALSTLTIALTRSDIRQLRIQT